MWVHHTTKKYGWCVVLNMLVFLPIPIDIYMRDFEFTNPFVNYHCNKEHINQVLLLRWSHRYALWHPAIPFPNKCFHSRRNNVLYHIDTLCETPRFPFPTSNSLTKQQRRSSCQHLDGSARFVIPNFSKETFRPRTSNDWTRTGKRDGSELMNWITQIDGCCLHKNW